VNYNDDAHWDELVGMSQEGRPKRGKTSSMNYALMANLQNSFEPQDYEEAKGNPLWKMILLIFKVTLKVFT
jgi:hypothetical protein